MRCVVQRVKDAQVVVDGDVVGSIESGILALVGVVDSDTSVDAAALASKLVTMRIFPDDFGKMNLSVTDTRGSILLVSQFTLLADMSRGRRPSFTAAARPDHARELIDSVGDSVSGSGVHVETGRFAAAMVVTLTNMGPVTFIVDVADGRVLH